MKKKLTRRYVDDFGELQEVDAQWFREATLPPKEPKKTSITLRLKTSELQWLKAQGKGYQTRLQRLISAYIAALKTA